MGECSLGVDAIQLHPSDNTATALSDLVPGQTCAVAAQHGTLQVLVREAIPFCHKVALRRILPGEPVLKYGQVIGEATELIECGWHVHVHNVVGRRTRHGGPGVGKCAG